MIDKEQVTGIGRLFKPHGYKGDLKFETEFEREFFTVPNASFFVEIDNILVPFFVDKIGGGSAGTAFIKFKWLDSDVAAAILSNKELYALKSFIKDHLGVEEDELLKDIDEIIGFSVVDSSNGCLIGMVEGIEEGVEYDYLTVKTDDTHSVSIPLVEEFVIEIREREDGEGKGFIEVSLPDGFLEI